MHSQEKILVPLAQGFEEIEAVTIIDVLRRAELDVVVAGLGTGPVTGAHGLEISTDCAWDDLDLGGISALVLPGGMPGTTHLMEDQRVLALVRKLHADGRPVAAICAAPMVLAAAGVLGEGPVTCYPGLQGRLASMLEEEPSSGSGFDSGPVVGPEFGAGVLGESSAASGPGIHPGRSPMATVVDHPRVVRQGRLLTSQGVGTALEFALALVAELVSPERSSQLATEMVVAAPE